LVVISRVVQHLYVGAAVSSRAQRLENVFICELISADAQSPTRPNSAPDEVCN
jgi:hypothetical protein